MITIGSFFFSRAFPLNPEQVFFRSLKRSSQNTRKIVPLWRGFDLFIILDTWPICFHLESTTFSLMPVWGVNRRKSHDFLLITLSLCFMTFMFYQYAVNCLLIKLLMGGNIVIFHGETPYISDEHSRVMQITIQFILTSRPTFIRFIYLATAGHFIIF